MKPDLELLHASTSAMIQYCYGKPNHSALLAELTKHRNTIDKMIAEANIPATIHSTDKNKVREVFAALAHEHWSGWMKHLFQQTSPTDPTCVCNMIWKGWEMIPDTFVKRWKRQMNTPYAELPDEEKGSDLVMADDILEIVQKMRLNKIDD